ncbi:MAG: DegV family protein [Candidatus Heimdallarchaeaceae archaeon]
MKVKLVTDASALLPYEMMIEENIGFLQSLILMDGKEYRELTEIDRVEFINSLSTIDPYPTSSQVPLQDALTTFEKAVEDGYDEILYLALTPLISSHMNIARLAAKKVKNKIKVTIYQTDLTCGSQGAMVYRALQLLKKGKTVAEITSHLDSIKESIYTIGTTGELVSLFRTGKVKRGSIKGIMTSLLRLKPIVEINTKEGVVGIAVALNYKQALNKIIELMRAKINPELTYDLFLVDALNPELKQKIEKKITEAFNIKDVHNWEMSPVVCLTSGKGAVMATVCPSLED